MVVYNLYLVLNDELVQIYDKKREGLNTRVHQMPYLLGLWTG